MKVTGYQIVEAIEQHRLRLEALNGQFSSSLFAYEGESKPDPLSIAEGIARAEACIADLQALQALFNSKMIVTVQGEGMSLAQAIKRKGGLGRLAKLWKSAMTQVAGGATQGSWRTSDQIVAKATISQEAARLAVSNLVRLERAYQAAIALANAQEFSLENVSPALFEA